MHDASAVFGFVEGRLRIRPSTFIISYKKRAIRKCRLASARWVVRRRVRRNQRRADDRERGRLLVDESRSNRLA
jgi:hypothetical protein